jgi:hypothetical protein
MLDRFVPVAGMLMPDEMPSPTRTLEAQHRAELRLAVHGPSLASRLAASAVDRARRLVSPAPMVCPEGDCNPA